MLVTAWEDPDNEDATLDAVEDDKEVTIEEKIGEVQTSLDDLKEKLGLQVNTEGTNKGGN